MFSVEQVEYVRRVRSTGLTRDQVLDIWDRLERIDAEQQTAKQAVQQTQPATVATPMLQMLQQQEQKQQANNSLLMMQIQQILQQNKLKMQQEPADVAFLQQQQQQQNNNDSDKTSSIISAVSPKSEMNNGSSDRKEVPARLVDENDPELIEFVKNNGETAICEQIRQFIAVNGIKQHQVAVLVGTSQSYISKYLKADYLEMSERSRRNIYRWYVTYRNDPSRASESICSKQFVNLIN